MVDQSLLPLAEKLLLAVKKQVKTRPIREALANTDLTQLKRALSNDLHKKAFWINLYNAYYQILRGEEDLPYPEIYRKPAFTIAGKRFSLDDLEHGILRRYRYKHDPKEWNVNFKPGLLRSLMVDTLDYRIHFALNCGAASCPPIAFYQVERLDQQLDLATQSFLESESEFNVADKTIHTTALFDWFADDFGGEKGIQQIFLHQLEQDVSDWRMVYKDYSWEENLGNFISEPV